MRPIAEIRRLIEVEAVVEAARHCLTRYWSTESPDTHGVYGLETPVLEYGRIAGHRADPSTDGHRLDDESTPTGGELPEAGQFSPAGSNDRRE